MKKTPLIALVCFTLNVTSAQENAIKLPITIHDGYGPFYSGFGAITKYEESQTEDAKKMRLKISQLPQGLTDITTGEIESNYYQSMYLEYINGNLDTTEFESLKLDMNWSPDSLGYSKLPVKTKIAFAIGKNADGESQMVLDANNNLDLSDDPIFKSPQKAQNGTINDAEYLKEYGVSVKYEYVKNGLIVQDEVTLLLNFFESFNLYLASFAQYATAELGETTIAINSSNSVNLSYNNVNIMVYTDSMKNGSKTDHEKIIREEEYIEIEGQLYQSKGVINRALILLPIDQPKANLYSTQIGFKTHPFKDTIVNQDTVLALSDLKGKYVLLDFWATWCSPCIQEMPNLKKVYDQTDRSEFEIIGIVCDSQDDAIATAMGTHDMTWPQVKSTELNQIKEVYNITGYPTVLLLDHDGVIIAKGLRGKDLEEKLNELLKP